MKIAFAGTPEFAAVALERILDAGFSVCLVLTQPDRPAGRGMALQTSPVKKLAIARGIPIDQPEKLRTPEQQAALRAAQPDVLVVAAYGLILPQTVLDLPTKACINIHASLLPRWRGAAPIHRAIEAGDELTGITIMRMEAGLDTGPMLLKRAIPILLTDTTASLHDRLARLGGDLIVETLERLREADIPAQTQPEEGVTYASKIDKSESALDFRQPAAVLARKIRAFDPFPGSSAVFEGNVVKVWAADVIDGHGVAGEVLSVSDDGVRVACGDGALLLKQLQKGGGKRLPAADFLRGFPIATGCKFAVHD